MRQTLLFEDLPPTEIQPFRTQLLKWVGNKQRFAHEIAASFPTSFKTYYEPFLGSGAVLATLAPKRAVASDAFGPIIEIFTTLVSAPELLKDWYRERWEEVQKAEKVEGYERIKASYNRQPNGPDLLFLCRACYGGVVRFRKADGYMSTPCGPHAPISPESFSKRVDIWYERLKKTQFRHADYREVMREARKGDLIYCDPPYVHSQAILYGGQDFALEDLLSEIADCRSRGVHVALSIDGTKKSGDLLCDLPIPPGVFEEEIYVNLGRSMLRRFQMGGQSLETELVTDRLLLTYQR